MSVPGLSAESSSARARRLRAAERRIVIGLVVSLVMAIVSGAVSVWRSVEARKRLLSLTVDEAQLVQLLSEAGRDVSRLRGAALEQSLAARTPSGVTAPGFRLEALEADLDRLLGILDPLLEARGHGMGEGLRGSFVGFRKAIARFEEAQQSGSAQARAAALEEVLAYATRIQTAIDALLVEAQAGSSRSLSAMKNEFTDLTDLELLLSLMVVAGLLAVWMGVLRTSRTTSRVLKEYVDRIEEVNRDLDAFAGRVAHDFRNVLGPLPLLSSRLRRGRVSDQDKAADQLDRIARRGGALVSGLLAFSRMGTVQDESGASVKEAIVDVLDELSPLVESSAARVELDLQDAEVACAPALLHMVIANVMTNALKYLNGTGRRVMRVESRARADGATIVVRDTGPGIPGEYLSHVFEPFFRVPGSQTEGTGLGLPTVRRIIEASGGYVTLQSEIGEGTAVSIWLPSARRATSRPVSRPSERPPLIH